MTATIPGHLLHTIPTDDKHRITVRQIIEHEDANPGDLFRAFMDLDAPFESAASFCRNAGC